MLIFSRKSQESVVVGGHQVAEQMLKVTVLGIKGGRVTLGFEVDDDVPVHRLEVWERICAERPQGAPARGASQRQPGSAPRSRFVKRPENFTTNRRQ